MILDQLNYMQSVTVVRPSTSIRGLEISMSADIWETREVAFNKYEYSELMQNNESEWWIDDEENKIKITDNQ